MFKIVILLLGVAAYSNALTAINSHVTSADNMHWEHVILEAMESNDIQAIYYSVITLKPHELAAHKQNVCGKIAAMHQESKLSDLEKNFYLLDITTKLSCPEKVDAKIKSTVQNAHTLTITTSQDLYYVYFALKSLGNVGETIQSKFGTNLQAILKKDDSLVSLAYGFYVAAELGAHGRQTYDWVESAFAQADEVDGKLLQFEGGLSITGLVFMGAIRLTESLKKPLPITNEQLVKFTNYFLSRRSVQLPKGISILTQAYQMINALKDAPICIKLIENSRILAESPNLVIAIGDIFGMPLKQPVGSVTANIISKPGNTALLTKTAFVSKSSNNDVYSLDLSKSKPSRGSYVAEVFVDNFQQNLNFNVLGKVKVQSFEIGVGEIDSTSSLKKSNLNYPNKLPNELAADFQQKVVFRAMLVDELTTTPLTVHQAFVRLENQVTREEIIFVAEQDSTKAYKFDMDIGARGGEFGYKTGLYSLEFFVGDASLSNSFKWHICDINLKFAGEPKVTQADKLSTRIRPEIMHQFRQPESRPPQMVSTFFTVLCGIPLLVLFYLWAKLRVNVYNFSFNLFSIGFHVGFGVILTLFVLFFIKFNMFETIRYLMPVALITFFCGNRLLRTIANNRSNDSK